MEEVHFEHQLGDDGRGGQGVGPVSRYADWYAVELDGYLRGRMSEVQRFEATKEILNHFAEHVDDLVSKGMDPVEAEKAAIVTFGSPRQAAINLMGQAKEHAVGRWLIWVGCAMIAWLTFGTGLNGILFQLNAYIFGSFNFYYYQYLHQAWTILAICLIAGTILTRRVPVVKMLVAGAAGIAAIAVFFFVGPEINYGNVPKANQAAMMSKWQSAHAATQRLAELEESIIEPAFSYNYRDGKYMPRDAALAIARIKSEAPKMLGVNSEYVKVAGSRTTGYLGPLRISNSHRWTGEDEGMKQGYRVPETGDTFTVAQRTLQYYETPEAALNAWSDSQSMYGQSYSLFGTTARGQGEYIELAKKYLGSSNSQLLLATIGPVIMIVLAFLGCMMIVGWPLTKLPNLTLRTSFRRRFA